jgi:hypothetical protein
VAAHLPVDIVEKSLEVLSSEIWETAAAIPEITAHAHPSQSITTEHFMNELLQFHPDSCPDLKSFWLPIQAQNPYQINWALLLSQ